MRLDKYLLFQNKATSRSKAVDLIKRGFVCVNNVVVTKQAYNIKSDDAVYLKENYKYVSRGGYKLDAFFKKINFDLENKIILDIGCSNGGFSDYFLQNKCKRIIAVDIAKKILDNNLLKNSNLTFVGPFDATNKNNYNKLSIQKFDIISIDLTGVSLKKVLLYLPNFLNSNGVIIALFKPHYEGGKGIVFKQKLNNLQKDFEEFIFKKFSIIKKELSDLKGGSKSKGNTEVFYLLKPK